MYRNVESIDQTLMAEDQLSINITIDERTYPLKIARSNEEKIRKAAELLNGRVLKYKSTYSEKDAYDFLAMAALQFVVELVENDTDTSITNFKNEIKQITSDIDVYLEQNIKE